MNWPNARIALVTGKRVRRENWETCLKFQSQQIRWQISTTLARVNNDDGSSNRIYAPSALDMMAEDWTLV